MVRGSVAGRGVAAGFVMRRRPRPRTLRISDDSRGKLADRGIAFADAEYAITHRPLLSWQSSRERPPEEGTGTRPGRWVMIGQGEESDIITFVLDEPDADGVSAVVTGWVATADEMELYNQSS